MRHTIDPSVDAGLNRMFGLPKDPRFDGPLMQTSILYQHDTLVAVLIELLAAIADPALGPDDGLALEDPYRAAVNRRDAAVENARAAIQATGG